MSIPRKPLLLFFGLLGIVGIVVVALPRDNFSCHPTTNPFPTQDPKGNYLFKENFLIGKVCTFSGKLKRGQNYRRDITQGLVFCLTPDSFWQKDGGWRLNVSDNIGAPCDDNFAGIATPPFRGGYNATFIEGWNFTNDSNTATPLIHEDTCCGFRRIFNFVLNQQDYETLFRAAFSPNANDSVDVSKIRTDRGILTIKRLELGNLIPNGKPWIESMEFDVTIYLPPD